MKGKSDEILNAEQTIKMLANELRISEYEAIRTLPTVPIYDSYSNSNQRVYRQSQVRAFVRNKLLRD